MKTTNELLRVARAGNGVTKKTKIRLAESEVSAIVEFIREKRASFGTKSACFSAAMEAAGVVGKILPNSTAVNRYFAKALAQEPKRKYMRRAPVPEQHIHVNFCPNCACQQGSEQPEDPVSGRLS